MQRAEVFVTEPVIHIELAGDLPRILNIRVEGIYRNGAFRVAHRDRGCRHISGKKISQRGRVAVNATWCGWSRADGRGPRSLRSIEGELPGTAAEIELINAALANLASKAELMLSKGVGDDVREMAGDVIAAFRWRQTDMFKISDHDLRRATNRLPVHFCIWAQEQAHGFGIEFIVEVMEDLVEIIHTKQHLIG